MIDIYNQKVPNDSDEEEMTTKAVLAARCTWMTITQRYK